ncbi:MAG: hypothetical protein ABI479_03570 [Gallionella sp.]
MLNPYFTLGRKTFVGASLLAIWYVFNHMLAAIFASKLAPTANGLFALKQLLIDFTLAAMAIGVISMGNAAETGLASQISNERGVKVTVSVKNLYKEAETWHFEVTLETHTQDLKEDMAKSSTLIADGKQYLPLGWEGAPPGSHHRKGLLRFKSITPQPSSVELQIHLNGESAPRSFKWIMKGARNGN